MICERCHQRYWYPGETGPPSNTVGPEASAPAIADAPTDTAAAGPTGTIEGHIRLAGDPPGNAVIRMGVDPLCSQLTEGKLMVQESVLTSPDESLANVFVRLEGTFPETPVPEEPVVIDQTDCVFVPRVVGARTGQLVQIKNNDPLLHNLNSQSTSNRFNVGQPMQGMVYEVQLEEEENMLRIRCDLHRWMTEYIGVVSHPYFAVTDLSGTFIVNDVPTGTHTIQAWHEEYGVLTQTVTVEAGAVDAVAIAAIVVLNTLLGVTQDYRAPESNPTAGEARCPTGAGPARWRHTGRQRPGSGPGRRGLTHRRRSGPRRRPGDRKRQPPGRRGATSRRIPAGHKDESPLANPAAVVSDRHNMVYMGTNVTYGRGRVVVTETGMQTELGHVSRLIETIEDVPTPRAS